MAEWIERQQWLEPLENGLQKAIGDFWESTGEAGRELKNCLHGTWLGHPLHPVLTDIPLGAWTATAVLDAMEASGHRRCAESADVALKVGLAGAAGAALAGLTDWQATDGKARRTGIVHGLLNLTSVTLYAASLACRNRKDRASGRALAGLGFAVSIAAAYLGGDLVYGQQIGVHHTSGEPPEGIWTTVMPEADLRSGEPHRADVNGVRILLVRRDTRILAIAEVCSHMGGPLAEGKVEGEIVQCPWHGSRFSLEDGSVVDGPATHPQSCYETRVALGQIEIRPRV